MSKKDPWTPPSPFQEKCKEIYSSSSLCLFFSKSFERFKCYLKWLLDTMFLLLLLLVLSLVRFFSDLHQYETDFSLEISIEAVDREWLLFITDLRYCVGNAVASMRSIPAASFFWIWICELWCRYSFGSRQCAHHGFSYCSDFAPFQSIKSIMRAFFVCAHCASTRRLSLAILYVKWTLQRALNLHTCIFIQKILLNTPHCVRFGS